MSARTATGPRPRGGTGRAWPATRGRAAPFVFAVLALLLSLAPSEASGHAARSSLRTNSYLWLVPGPESLDGVFSVAFGDLPAAALRAEADLDRNGVLDDAEVAALAEELGRRLLACLEVTVEGARAEVRVVAREVTLDEPTVAPLWVRADLHLSTPLRAARARVVVIDRCELPARGEAEARVEPASGVRLLEQDPAPGPRDEGLVELRPSAAGTRRLALVLEPAGAVATSGQAERAVSPLPAREADPLVELLRAPGSVTLWALLLALLLGALHALAPGHGKALVAAYLVGQRGTARHALLLGLVVTFTHVSSVLALGLAALAASAYVLPERLSPYLTVASGALIVVIGGGLLRARWRAWKGVPGHGHEHGHEHEHEHGHEHGHEHEPRGAVSLRSLLGLGVAGGLVPCPSALVVLLLALALGRIAEGLALIVAFSLGLAAVLVAIGLAVVRAGRLVDRLWPRARWLAALPLVSAVVVTLVGLGVTAGGLRELASRGWLPGP